MKIMKKFVSILIAISIIGAMNSSFAVDSNEEVRILFSWQGIDNEQLAEMVANGTIPRNVTELGLVGNRISDLTPLSELTNLRSLNLIGNQITDITPLSSLTNLGGDYGALDLSDNKITDIKPLSNLTKLQWLSLDNNQITDLTPLYSLTNLNFITLHGNPITPQQESDLKAALKKYSTFVNRILNEDENVTVAEALEILKYLAKMDSVIDEGNVAFYAARITGGDKPRVNDALEILKCIAKMPNLLDNRKSG